MDNCYLDNPCSVNAKCNNDIDEMQAVCDCNLGYGGETCQCKWSGYMFTLIAIENENISTLYFGIKFPAEVKLSPDTENDTSLRPLPLKIKTFFRFL